ncbi:uncharacterized protein MONOS_18610 [Monocercomonoides exilis]|uniref:uncharacterized protein n=1 Tax=Monocercomonoides exilis TaxID=2049356 RepID=UPI00355A964B|nr:hypothetical protein MONOS_18610 [Monocercomonoides exilis]
MNELIEEMDEEELEAAISINTFNEIEKMIEEKKLLIEDAILSLKYAEYNKTLKGVCSSNFAYSSFRIRFEKMILAEESKKVKNERLMIDLCECYLFLCEGLYSIPEKLLAVCVPCLLNVALQKEENEETQKEVEIALLALFNISESNYLKNIQFLLQIIEIIKHHLLHRNLTHLARQSVWKFLIDRSYKDRGLASVFLTELHFMREAIGEMEDLARRVDWRGKGKKGKDIKDVWILKRWISTLYTFLYCHSSQKEESIGFCQCIVNICREAKDNQKEIFGLCIELIEGMIKTGKVTSSIMLESGAIDIVFEEIRQQAFEHGKIVSCLGFFASLSHNLIIKATNEQSEDEWKKIKRKIFDKLEEEGFEDIITSFQEILMYLERFYFNALYTNFEEYFISL